MKIKTIPFALFVLSGICLAGMFPGFVRAQAYHKLIRTNTYWDDYHMDPIFCYEYVDRIFFTSDDTIIGGISYTKSRQFTFIQVIQPGPYCPPFVVDTISHSTSVYIREDTIAKKVYFYTEGFDPPDQLLYDFTIIVGDTLNSLYNGNRTLVVTSIADVILNNGEVRKKYSFNNMGDVENYIEGIGGSQGLFNSIIFSFNDRGGYFCIRENGINLWGSDCNYQFVGIPENKTNGFLSVSPNPAKTEVVVKYRLSEIAAGCCIEITDIMGKTLNSIPLTIKEDQKMIPVNHLSQGVYIVTLKNRGKAVQQAKIVVIR